MPDKRELRAKIVGVDEATDIAVLKIDADNLPTLPWGDSSKLRGRRVGARDRQPVPAQSDGHARHRQRDRPEPRGAARDLRGLHPDRRRHQSRATRAARSINARGELVGINTAIFSETGGYQGIGFAVPSNLARHVMDDLIKYGEVQRGTIQRHRAAAADDAARRAARRAEHARRRWSSGWTSARRPTPPASARATSSSASTATTIDDASQFIRLLSDAKIGSIVTLGLVRDGKRLSVEGADRESRRRAGNGAATDSRIDDAPAAPDTAALPAATAPPLRLHADGDADPSRSTRHRARAGRDPRSAAAGGQIAQVLVERDAERARQVARAAAQLRGAERAGRTAGAAGAAAPHQRLTLERLERADQHGGGRAFGFGHRVDQIVDAVIQVDVRDPGRPVERRVARASVRAPRGTRDRIRRCRPRSRR